MSQELLEEIDRPEGEGPETPEPEKAETPEAPIAEPEKETSAEPAAVQPANTQTKEPERTVPLATLLEERRRFEAKLRELEARQNKAEPVKPETKADPEIDYVQDPKGYVDLKVQKALSKLEQLEKDGLQSIGQTREQVAEIQLVSAINAAESQIAGEIPDYQQALNHVRGVRLQQLQLINPDATVEQLLDTLSREEKQMASAELSRNRNPYRLLYEVAKTFGYTPPAAKPAAPVVTIAAKPNGATPTLSPDLTLGKTGGSAPDAAQADEGEEDDILSAAFSERFGRKRA